MIRSFTPVVTIGRYSKVRKAIIDKNVQVPEGMRIGYDEAEDRRHGLTVTEEGIVAVPKNARFDVNSNVMKPHIGQLEARNQMLRTKSR